MATKEFMTKRRLEPALLESESARLYLQSLSNTGMEGERVSLSTPWKCMYYFAYVHNVLYFSYGERISTNELDNVASLFFFQSSGKYLFLETESSCQSLFGSPASTFPQWGGKWGQFLRQLTSKLRKCVCANVYLISIFNKYILLVSKQLLLSPKT